MHTFFRGKVVRITPKRYDEEFRARAVRLVTDYAEEYGTRTACLTAVAKRLGVSYESLPRWINQAEVDAGVRDGATTDTARELREHKRGNKELDCSRDDSEMHCGANLLEDTTTFVRYRRYQVMPNSPHGVPALLARSTR